MITESSRRFAANYHFKFLFHNFQLFDSDSLICSLNLSSLHKDVIRLRNMKLKNEKIERFEEFARRFISWAHKNIKKPWKDYYDCLEMYRSALILKANCYSPDLHPLLEIDP